MKRKGFITLLVLISLPVLTLYKSVDNGTFAGQGHFFGQTEISLAALTTSPSDHQELSQPVTPVHSIQNSMFGWNIFENKAGDLQRLFLRQDSVEVDLTNFSTIEELAGILGSTLEHDSLAFFNLFLSECYLRTFNVDQSAVKAYLLPCRFKLSCTTGPSEFLQKMLAGFEQFWTEKRIQQAEKIGLTPLEVVILASIVDGETWKEDEMPKIAGLYLNRLSIGMRLQADPTVIFACKQKDPDWEITRVQREHLCVDSPFNTYLYKGLPPSPISMPDSASIEAVLYPQIHDYLFMVANPDSFGYHTFSKTLEEHRIHRDKYIAWLESKREPEIIPDSLIIPDCMANSDSISEIDSLVVNN